MLKLGPANHSEKKPEMELPVLADGDRNHYAQRNKARLCMSHSGHSILECSPSGRCCRQAH